MALKIADNPAYFKQYLDMQGIFPRYSVNNVLLLAEQMPAAIKVGELHYWREQNVYIKNQEFNKQLLILEPGDEYRREDGSVGTYTMQKRSMIFHRRRMDVIKNLVRCMALSSNSPAQFKSLPAEQIPEGYAVMYDLNSDKIYMKNGLDDGNKVFQLTSMKIAHAILAQENPSYD